MRTSGPHAHAKAGLAALPLSLCLLLIPAEFPRAQTSTLPTSPDLPGPGVVLSNGLRVMAFEVEERPLVGVVLVYDAGACREDEDQGGLAHLVEHLMFTSSAARPEQHLNRELELHTVENNGWTASYAMGYELRCLPEELPGMLQLEADRMAGLLLNEEIFERERRVVSRERELRSFRSPFQDLISACFWAAYEGHPLGREASGTAESVDALTLEDVHAFHEEFIRPGRAVLVVAGPLPEDEMIATARAAFEPIDKPGSGASMALPELPPPQHQSAIRDRFDHQGMIVAYGLRVPRTTAREEALTAVLLELFDAWVGGVRSYRRSGETLVVVYRWYSQYDAGPERRRMEVNADYDAQEALAILWRDLGASARHLRVPSKMEVLREQARDRVGARTSNQGLDPREVALEALLWESIHPASEVDSILSSLEPSDCLEYLQFVLDADRTVNGVLHGQGSGRTPDISVSGLRGGGQEDENAWEAPPLPDAETLQTVLDRYSASGLPGLERQQWDDGNGLLSWNQPGLDEVRIGGFRHFDALKELCAKKKPGMGALYGSAAPYGSRRHSPEEEPEVYRLPYRLSVEANAFGFEFSARGPSRDQDRIFDTLRTKLNDSKVDGAAWIRVLRNAPQWYDETYVRSEPLAERYRRSVIFGESHPSLWSEICPARTHEKVTYDNINRFHEELASRLGLQWIAAGDLDLDFLQSNLPETPKRKKKPRLSKALPASPPLETIQGKVFSSFERAEARLTFAFPAHDLVNVEDAWACAAILNRMLDRRLTETLRQREGLVYYLHAIPDLQGSRLSVVLVTGSSPANATRVFELVQEELSTLAQNPLDPSELLLAKIGATCRLLQGEGDASAAFSSMLEMARFGDIPIDPVDTIRNVDAGRFEELLHRLVTPGAFVFTVEGPILEEEIESFELRARSGD